jgi:hypothetical protein
MNEDPEKEGEPEMSRKRSRREFLKAISLAGAAAVTGAAIPKEAVAQTGWCTNDLDFDGEGCLFIRNEALARAIQQHMDNWGGHLCMRRDKFPEETSSDGGPIEGNKINVLCPC